MRHLVKGRKLKRTASHRKALLANLATSLFEHKKITTTLAKAKELRPYAEHLITKARTALMRERQGLLPEGHTVDVHNRRIVGRVIRKKAVLQELFDAIAPVVESRNGGYTRIIKLGTRRGDAARLAVIELVDWSAPQDGAFSTKSKKKAAKKTSKPASKKADEPKSAPKEVVEEKPVEPQVAATEVVEETQAPEEIANDTAETSASEEPTATADETINEEQAPENPEAAQKITFDDTAEQEEQK